VTRSTGDGCAMDALEDQSQEHPQEQRLAREIGTWWPPPENTTPGGCATSQVNMLQLRRDPCPEQLTLAGAMQANRRTKPQCPCHQTHVLVLPVPG